MRVRKQSSQEENELIKIMRENSSVSGFVVHSI